jgi:hypothetical protein
MILYESISYGSQSKLLKYRDNWHEYMHMLSCGDKDFETDRSPNKGVLLSI